MNGATFTCPSCHETFYYRPSREAELLVMDDMRDRDPRLATLSVQVLVECTHCPAHLVLDLTKGEASALARGDDSAGGIMWDWTATEDVKRQVARLNEEGDTARAQGKLDTAKKKFEEAIRLRKHDPLSWYNLGVVLYQSGDLAGAERAFRDAIEHDEHFVNALNNLGMILAQAGRADEAEECFDRGIAAEPDYPKCYLGKANVCAMRGDLAQARRYLELALSKDPTYEAAREALRRLG